MDVREAISLIKSCETLSQAKSVHSRITSILKHRQQDTNLQTFLSNLSIQMFSKCRDLSFARNIFHQLHERKNFFSWALMLAANAQHGDVEESKKLFDQMPVHDLLSWTTMIKACIRASYLEQARSLFEQMPERDVISWTDILTAFAASGDFLHVKSIFDSMPEHDLVSWTALLTSSCRQNQEYFPFHIFSSMPEWNLTTCNIILDRIAGDRLLGLNDARTLFDMMPELDIISWNTMLTAYLHHGSLHQAMEFFNTRMPFYDVISWTKMLTGLAENGFLHEAVQVFDRIPEKDVVSWTTMLNGYARFGHFDEAATMFYSMPQRSSVSYTAWLSVCSQNGYLGETVKLFHSMPERNPVSWNAMISAYARHGHISSARKLLKTNPFPGVASWNSMLSACARDGHSEDGLELFMELVMEGRQPDETCFVCLLQACSHRGDAVSSIGFLLAMIRDHGLTPSKQHFCCVIDLLGRAGRVGDAEEVLANMPYVPEAVEWLCFLGACRSQRQSGSGTVAAQSALRMEPRNPAPYSLLANIYS